MFEKLKQYFQKNEKETVTSPVIITIHGYGRRCQHEFDNFALWGRKDGFTIVQFDMYDLFDEQDCDWKQWLARAKDQVKRYKSSGVPIYLVGFSMGGVIASYLAATFQVDRLILLAPAFSYINMDMVSGVITKTAPSLWSNEKKEEIKLPSSFYSAFMDIVKNLKKYIVDVECPVLFLHGDQDEVISIKSSLWAYEKLPHDRKKLIILHEGHHRLLMDENVHWECYQIMKLFLNKELLGDTKIIQAEDIMDSLIEKKRAMMQESTKEKEINGELPL